MLTHAPRRERARGKDRGDPIGAGVLGGETPAQDSAHRHDLAPYFERYGYRDGFAATRPRTPLRGYVSRRRRGRSVGRPGPTSVGDRSRPRILGIVNATFWLCSLTAGATLLVPAIPALLGYRTLVVMSGSMGPEIRAGDALLVRADSPGDVAVGDVITFQPFGAHQLKTHRVVALEHVHGHLFFQTKGDANPAPDPDLADSDALIGTTRMHLPAVGRLLVLATSPLGRLMLLGLPALLLALQQVVALRRMRRGSPSSARESASARSIAPALALILICLVGGSAIPHPAGGLLGSTVSVGDNVFRTASGFVS
jgi:signal peptidase I